MRFKDNTAELRFIGDSSFFSGGHDASGFSSLIQGLAFWKEGYKINTITLFYKIVRVVKDVEL